MVAAVDWGDRPTKGTFVINPFSYLQSKVITVC